LLHIGIIIGVVFAIVVWILLWRTTLGYRIRAVGKNPRASRYAGIRVKRYTVLSLLLSGGFAGLAGGIQVLGVRHRMSAEGGAIAFTGNAALTASSPRCSASCTAGDHPGLGAVRRATGWRQQAAAHRSGSLSPNHRSD
jgi:hypothetical protein